VLAQPIHTFEASPSGSPISSTSRWGAKFEQASIVSLSECAISTAISPRQIPRTHPRQVGIVLDNQNRAVPPDRRERAPARSAAHLLSSGFATRPCAPPGTVSAPFHPLRSTTHRRAGGRIETPQQGRIAHPFMPSRDVSTRMACAPCRAAASVCSTVEVCTTS